MSQKWYKDVDIDLAIEEANNSDILKVNNLAWLPSFTVNKPLTLLGNTYEEGSKPVIYIPYATEFNNAAINITSDGVKILGFQIRNCFYTNMALSISNWCVNPSRESLLSPTAVKVRL